MSRPVVRTQLVTTSAGPVELGHIPGTGSPVLVMPGAQFDARGPGAEAIYRDLGLETWTVSRPGHGRTDVGRLTIAEFTPVLVEALDAVGVRALAAVVGIGLGAQQAIDLAARCPDLVGRLIVHSGAPSGLPQPLSAARRAVDARLEHTRVPATRFKVADAVARRGISGLGMVAGGLGRMTGSSVVHQLTADERAEARAVIAGRKASDGFAFDREQARITDDPARLARMAAVRVPTLVTASRHDATVPWVHAMSLAERIPGAQLVDNDAPWYLFWIGPGRRQVVADVRRFLDANPAGPLEPLQQKENA